MNNPMPGTQQARECAYAKLNLSLDITGRRPDGYHDMMMVMQTISLRDEVTLKLEGEGIRAESGLHYLPSDGKNLAVQAAEKFFQRLGEGPQGLLISLQKQIPVGAGMAGGSADAAAVLRGLNRMYGQPFARETLLEMGAQVGSDVPYCIVGGTMLATGRGEILSPLPEMPSCRLLVCKPGFSISTPELFRKADAARLRVHPDHAGMRAALEAGDLMQLSRRMYNVFEDVNDRRIRTITEIKSRLLEAGALGAVMTGTGSAVFGVFEEKAVLGETVRKLKKEYGFAVEAKPVGKLL